MKRISPIITKPQTADCTDFIKNKLKCLDHDVVYKNHDVVYIDFDAVYINRVVV